MEPLLKSLAAHLSQSDDQAMAERLCKLIRPSPKDDKEVDLVLPTLQVWKKCLGNEAAAASSEKLEALVEAVDDLQRLEALNSASLTSSDWRFSKVSVKNEKVLAKLDRAFVISHFLPILIKEGHRFMPLPSRGRVQVVNCELSQHQDSGAFSQLSEIRCNQVNLLKEDLVYVDVKVRGVLVLKTCLICKFQAVPFGA